LYLNDCIRGVQQPHGCSIPEILQAVGSREVDESRAEDTCERSDGAHAEDDPKQVDDDGRHCVNSELKVACQVHNAVLKAGEDAFISISHVHLVSVILLGPIISFEIVQECAVNKPK